MLSCTYKSSASNTQPRIHTWTTSLVIWLWLCSLIWNKADSFNTITDNLVRRQAKAKRTVIPVYVDEVQSKFLACTGNSKKKKGGQELIDLLKDTHILFSVHGPWWTVSWLNELSRTNSSGGDQMWSVMFIDKRPGSDTPPYRLWSELRVLADLTEQWSSSCSSVWGDMAGVSVLHSTENAGCCQVFQCWMSSWLWHF